MTQLISSLLKKNKIFFKPGSTFKNIYEKMDFIYSSRKSLNHTKFRILYLERLIKTLPNVIKKAYIFKDQMFITVSKNDIVLILTYLKLHTTHQYSTLMDFTCIDFPNKIKRFVLVYNLMSYRFNTRLIIQTQVSEFDALESMVAVHPAANWLEREIWDMFGVFFSNHPDLRRILTDYGFEGFPLRKDFPLMGFVEVRYDDQKKAIVYEPVELSQQYRTFKFNNPWERFINVNQHLKIDLFNFLYIDK
jgi:NADH/F420H2 dehydrogenase subunit C